MGLIGAQVFDSCGYIRPNILPIRLAKPPACRGGKLVLHLHQGRDRFTCIYSNCVRFFHQILKNHLIFEILHTVTGQCADCGKAIQRITDDYPSAIAAKLAMSRGLMRCDPCTTRARIGL